jgi:hypothetical protein
LAIRNEKGAKVMKKSYSWIFVLSLAVLASLSAKSYAGDLEDIVENLYTEDGVPGITLAGADTKRYELENELKILNSQIGTELSDVRLPSGVANIGLQFDLETDVPVRTTETFGPIYAERPQTIGKRRLQIGVSYSRFDFEEFEGDDISEVEVIPLTSDETVGLPPAFANDQLIVNADFDLEEDVVAFSAIYGITDRFDIGILVPYAHIDYKVSSHADIWGWNGSEMVLNPDPVDNPWHHFDPGDPFSDSPDSRVKGDADGLGDIILRAKYFLCATEYADVAVAMDVKLPTGDEDRYLGTGDLHVTPSIILASSYLNGRFNPHANIGYEFNGGGSDVSQLVWRVGFDSRITEWLTGTVDVIGFNELDGDGVGDDIFDVSLGLKLNPWRELVVFANVQLPLNDEGLRTDFTPTAGVEFSF